MPKIGAHVSAAVSLETSFKKAQEIGAEATQIFVSPPQQWLQTKHDSEELKRYQQAAQESGIGPNFIHGTYLVNLGTNSPEHVEKGKAWLIYALTLAREAGIEGVIFHPGSHKGVGFDAILPQAIQTLKEILETVNPTGTEGKPYLILETSAGAGNTIGDKFSELGKILKGVNHPSLKICLDTCHVYSANYDIKNNLDSVLEEFDKEIGLENLVAIHANDSKFDLASKKDRHENIGEGFLGKETFEGLINHPKLASVTFLLEVPGIAGTGPDQENVTLLKSLRH